jgi:hypothetical protein
MDNLHTYWCYLMLVAPHVCKNLLVTMSASSLAKSGNALLLQAELLLRNIEFSDSISDQWLGLALCKGPNRIGFSRTWGRKQIQFPKRRVSLSLFFNTRTMDRVRKLNIPESYTPSSESYSNYLNYSCLPNDTTNMTTANLALNRVRRVESHITYVAIGYW